MWLLCCSVNLGCVALTQENVPQQDEYQVPWVNQDDLVVDVCGTVCDEQGTPVVGATVRFIDPLKLFDPDFKQTSTVTDDKGKFHLKYNVMNAFRHLLVAESKERDLLGYSSFAFQLYDRKAANRNDSEQKTDSTGKVIKTPKLQKEMLENIPITVKKSISATGKVVDSEGNPVENAYVGVRYRSIDNDHSFFYVDFPGGFTDSEGKYKFSALDYPVELIYAFHKENGIDTATCTPNSNPVTFINKNNLFHLKKYPTRVRLIDSITKEPRTDVWVRSIGGRYFIDGNITSCYAIPDKDGVAYLPWIEPAKEYVIFDPISLCSFFPKHEEHPKEETEIVLKNHATSVYGKIYYPDGKPAAGIPVKYTSSLYLHRNSDVTDAYKQTWTDSQGRYEVSILERIGSSRDVDTFNVYLFPDVPGWVPSKLPMGSFPADGKPFRMDVELRKPTVIRGTVSINHPQKGKTPAASITMTLSGCMREWWQNSGIGMQT
ncbi:MAG: hypothetical protein ACRC2T_18520, partial [Thermoguttaceae bacterium]